MERTPSLFPSAHFEVKELPQVVTQSGNKGGILPPRAVPGTPKTIDTPIWLALHNNVALKLLQCLQTNLQRMLIQTTGFRVMMLGAGWQVADPIPRNLSSSLSASVRACGSRDNRYRALSANWVASDTCQLLLSGVCDSPQRSPPEGHPRG